MISSRRSVFGVDVGNNKTRICLAANRKIAVIPNKSGSRQTFTGVSFTDKQRLVGDPVAGVSGNKLKNKVTYFKRLVGRARSDPDMEKELQYISAPLANPENKTGDIVFSVKSEGKKIDLRPEQALTFFFSHVRETTQSKMEGQEANDCVLTVPQYWNHLQRQAILKSAEAAGLTPLMAMNELTAVALSYTMGRSLPEGKTRVAFVDMGHTSLCANIVEFDGGKTLKVLAAVSEPFLGGRQLDEILGDWIANYIKQKHSSVDVTNLKLRAKINKEAARLKHTLSANKVGRFQIDNVTEDGLDVGDMFDRDNLVKAIAPMLEQVTAVVKRLYREAQLDASGLASVEAVGGCVLVPAINDALEKAFGKSIGHTCDGQESVSRGAALQCAMLSHSFRMAREVKIQDLVSHPVTAVWSYVPERDDPSGDMGQTLFGEGTHYPSLKEFFIPSSQGDTQINMALQYEKSLPQGITSREIEKYNVALLTPTAADAPAPKLKLRVRMDRSGLVRLENTWNVQKKTEAELAAEAAANAAAAAPATPATPAAEPAAEAAAADGTSEPPSKKPKTEEAKADAAAPKKEAKKEEKKKEKKVKKSKTTEVKATTLVIGGLPATEWALIKASEETMSRADGRYVATENAKNELEGYVLNTPNALDSEYADFIEAAAAQDFKNALQEVEFWLEDDGWDVELELYEGKFKELKKMGAGVEHRHQESLRRPEAVAKARSFLGRVEKVLSSVQIIEPTAAMEETAEDKKEDAAAEEKKEEPAPTEEPTPAGPPVCGECGKNDAKKPIRCSRCKQISYCDRNCQKKHWKTHKKTCAEARKTPAAATSTSTASTVKPKACEMTTGDHERITGLYNEFNKWLSEQEAKQAATKKSENPVLLSSDIEKKIDDMENKCLRQIYTLEKELAVEAAKNAPAPSKNEAAKTEEEVPVLQIGDGTEQIE